MRTIVISLIVLAMPFSAALAGESDPASPDCFVHLENAAIVGDSVAVTTVDRTVTVGHRPIVNFASSLIYMRLSSDSTSSSHTLIRFEHIYQIEYRTHSNYRHGLTILGLGLGIATGVIVGLKTAPESSAMFGEIGFVGFTSMIGGVLGLVLSSKVGKNLTAGVTLRCR